MDKKNVELLQGKALPGSKFSYLSKFSVDKCYNKWQAIINDECYSAYICSDEQYEISNKSELSTPNYLGYVLTSYRVSCLNGLFHVIGEELKCFRSCPNKQFQMVQGSFTDSTRLGHYIDVDIYKTCCEAGYVQSVDGDECLDDKNRMLFDWNCYEAPITKELNCFVKDSPEASALPIHSSLSQHSCGTLPDRPLLKYIKVVDGKKTCEDGKICDKVGYYDGNT